VESPQAARSSDACTSGLVRRPSAPNFGNIQPIADQLHLVDGDLMDQCSLNTTISEAQPDGAYNLFAQTSMSTTFAQPVVIGETTGLRALRVLEAVRARTSMPEYTKSPL
jgi:GDPmannose 4,6-dehydratase